jgi:adenylate cyclase
MPKEIERKFLVNGDGWRAQAGGATRLRQAYLAATDAASVRIRILGGQSARLTVKSARPGMVRDEFEYRVPVADAEAMLGLCGGAPIEKIRHHIPFAGGELTVDEFLGQNAGLVVAEIELADADARLDLPDWIGREVTDERCFYNASLAERPFDAWTEAERTSACP